MRARMPVTSASPSDFEADLPTIEYDVTSTPAQVYPELLAAQRQAPGALGPFGPELLSYELVRTVLRDSRFQIPSGYILAVQGITSGPLWEKVGASLLGMEGDRHQRVRSVVSRAFTPRAVERLHATIADVIDEIVEPISRRGFCDVVADIARPYPVPVVCALIGAPREDWEQFALWTTRSSKRSHSPSRLTKSPTCCARGVNSTTTSTTWSPDVATR